MMEHPFYQKNIVFTGALSTMTRHTAAQKASAFGAVMQGAVTTHTHFVIIGDKRRGISTKHAKAQHLIALGHDIQLLEEADFLWLLSFNEKGASHT